VGGPAAARRSTGSKGVSNVSLETPFSFNHDFRRPPRAGPPRARREATNRIGAPGYTSAPIRASLAKRDRS
jgi:hypothetical protein